MRRERKLLIISMDMPEPRKRVQAIDTIKDVDDWEETDASREVL